jgi:hypothetical protein
MKIHSQTLCTIEPLDQDRNVGALVECRHDDRKFRRRPHDRDFVRAPKRPPRVSKSLIARQCCLSACLQVTVYPHESRCHFAKMHVIRVYCTNTSLSWGGMAPARWGTHYSCGAAPSPTSPTFRIPISGHMLCQIDLGNEQKISQWHERRSPRASTASLAGCTRLELDRRVQHQTTCRSRSSRAPCNGLPRRCSWRIRDRFESSQEQQSFETFIDHSVQPVLNFQVLHQAINCRLFAHLHQGK